MSDVTGIQWTDATWNPIVGCTRVSDGCRHCYAEEAAAGNVRRLRAIVAAGASAKAVETLRLYEDAVRQDAGGTPLARWSGRVSFDARRLADPMRWRRPRRIFVNSMSDLFHHGVTDAQVAAIFGVMAATPWHTYQVLTKRPDAMARWMHRMRYAAAPTVEECIFEAFCQQPDGDDYMQRHLETAEAPWPLPNVWLGISAENQDALEARLPPLLACEASVRFLSLEPLLGPINLPYAAFNGADSLGTMPGIGWVIVGGESGAGSRPCDVAWIERIVRDCERAGVPCFVKQMGAAAGLRDSKGGDMSEWPAHLRVRQMPRGVAI